MESINVSAYRKEIRELTLAHIKNNRDLNGNDIEDLIKIIEDHEKRIAELEDSTRLEKLIKDFIKECESDYE